MAKMYVYCPRGSDGAKALVGALPAVRLRRFDGLHFWDKNKRVEPEQGSSIVCWGATLPELDGLRVLNSMDRRMNKLEEINILSEAGVPTLRALKWERGTSAADYKRAGFLGRSFYHQGGTDLLGLSERIDYWTHRETFVKEYRVHSFAEKSIRAGMKQIREGFTETTDLLWKPGANLAHPWVRSFDSGWSIICKDFRSSPGMRSIAHKAVKALGLVFGAVDIGETSNGALKVLEVNTSPGIEGGTVDCYVKAIKAWVESAS